MTKAGVKGAKRTAGTDASARKMVIDTLGGEVNAGADLFAGVKGSGEFTGALQYLSSEAGDRFEDMASIGPKVRVQVQVQERPLSASPACPV